MRDLKINEQIEANRVRLIDLTGKQLGVVAFNDAMQRAKSKNVDLVQVNEDSSVPVCKLLDYRKYIFEKKKRQSASRKKHKRMVLKEVKFRPGTEEGDYKVKLKNLQKFLEQGDRTKITVRFRGREVVYKEQGYDVLKRVMGDLASIGEPEHDSKLEGKQLIIVLRPVQKQSQSKPQVQSQPDSQSKTQPKPKPKPQAQAAPVKAAVKGVKKEQAKPAARAKGKLTLTKGSSKGAPIKKAKAEIKK